LDEITSLLSTFGTNEENEHCEEEGGLTRSFSFPSGRGTIDVELNDAVLLDDDHTSVGLQSWGSAIVLAQKICANPASFSLRHGDGDETRPLRILELGAGTGLLSIIAAKILHRTLPSPIIIATDYHPDVMANLSANIRTNFPARSCAQLPVTVHTLDWEDPVYSAPLDERFDVVLAADVIYHPEHARLIKGCVERVLERMGTFWMIMARRTSGRHEGLYSTVGEMFPDASVVEKGGLAVLDRTELERLEGVGRADENDYVLFKIGWKDSRVLNCHAGSSTDKHKNF
jgi:predicted nicotinamide N-methyase